jgi:DNA-directed RNA polymerase specialized sigma24 family protein
MASGPGADSLPDEGGSAELVRRIQIGDQAAIRDLHSQFTTGIEFLLRRNLRKSSVSTEVASVLEAAVQEIQSSAAVNLRRVVAQAIHRLFPPLTADIAPDVADPSRERVAHSVLAGRPPLERDILRRYYLLREPTVTIRRRLRVSSGTIEKTIARARADFLRKSQRTESA